MLIEITLGVAATVCIGGLGLVFTIVHFIVHRVDKSRTTTDNLWKEIRLQGENITRIEANQQTHARELQKMESKLDYLISKK